MKRIYFDGDNLDAFAAWIKTAPLGMCQVLIGTDRTDFKVSELVEAVGSESRGTASALLFMLQSGQMEVKVGPKTDLPVGVPLED